MKLFCIVGTGRCGTQMLRNILKEWKNVRILPETHFIVPLYNRYGIQDISFEQFIEVVDNIYSQSGNKFIYAILADAQKEYTNYKIDFKRFVDKNHIDKNIKGFTESFFEFLYGSDSYIFGDKTPHYGIHAKIIKELWSEAKFIHIQRDGLDVAQSMLGHGGFVKLISHGVEPKDIDEFMYGKEMGIASTRNIDIEESLPYWENAILDTDRALNQFQEYEDYINVKYEDIVFQPVDEIIKIVNFLGIGDDKIALNKAITIPRPFPEKYQVNKLGGKEYEKYYLQVKETMQKFGYPYKVDIKRSFLETLQEFYRGRYNYLLNAKKSVKAFIKYLIVRV